MRLSFFGSTSKLRSGDLKYNFLMNHLCLCIFQVAESEVTPVHEIQDKNNDHDDEEEDSTARTNSSKSQSTSLVQKIKSLAT